MWALMLQLQQTDLSDGKLWELINVIGITLEAGAL
jgi:hypothetical protein